MTAVPPPYFTPGLRDAGALGVIATGSTTLRSLPDRFANTAKVKDFGALGNDVANDTAAIQAAINAAGVGGTIEFDYGSYFCTGTLTALDFQSFVGTGFFLGTGGSPRTQIRWAIAGATVGLQCGLSNSFTNLLFRGPGKVGNTCCGVQASPDSVTPSHFRFLNCQFYSWQTGANANPSYYAKFSRCEWNACQFGISCNGAYNVELEAPTMRCYDGAAATAGVGIRLVTACRNLKIIGGSIEGFSTSGAIIAVSGSQVSVYGTYFESSVAGTAAFGIEASNQSNVSINLFGCMVYLTEMNRWVNLGAATTSSLHSVGNKFVCPVTSSTTPSAYVLPASGNITIHSDDWSDVQKGSYTVALNGGPIVNGHISPPATLASFLSDYFFMGTGLALLVRTTPPNALNHVLNIADGVTWNPLLAVGGDSYPVYRDINGFRPMGYLKMAGPPGAGTWRLGDQVINSAPAAAAPAGWVCTVAGTPGIWRALANIP